MDQKVKKLQKITRAIEMCKACRQHSVGKAVPGEGNPGAKIVFLGEAPGKVESETGRPFVGRSGQLLRSLIRSAGFRERDVYITSPVKYLPTYKTPKPADINHGRTHLLEQLRIIRPKLLVLLGSTAVTAMLPHENIKILRDHGKTIQLEKYDCLITLHPAAVIRFPKYRGLIDADFLKIKKVLKE